MEIHINIAGILMIILALLHLYFPGYFKWKQNLRPLTPINRQMMYVHAFFIAFMVLLIGLLCLTSATELATTAFGKRISAGIGVFWATRLIIQFFGYSSSLWKGKSFETLAHILFSILWIYFATVFILNYLA